MTRADTAKYARFNPAVIFIYIFIYQRTTFVLIINSLVCLGYVL